MIVNSSELCTTDFDLREVIPLQHEVGRRLRVDLLYLHAGGVVQIQKIPPTKKTTRENYLLFITADKAREG